MAAVSAWFEFEQFAVVGKAPCNGIATDAEDYGAFRIVAGVPDPGPAAFAQVLLQFANRIKRHASGQTDEKAPTAQLSVVDIYIGGFTCDGLLRQYSRGRDRVFG